MHMIGVAFNNCPHRIPFLSHYNVWHYVIVQLLMGPLLFCSATFLGLKSMLYFSLIKYVTLMFRLVTERIRLLDSSITVGGPRLQHALDNVIKAHYVALRWVTYQVGCNNSFRTI